MEHLGKDPAPALGRGLALLGDLERDGASALEQLAGRRGWPKSSVLRLLTSLEAAGAVWRDPASKRYHARMRLVSVDANQDPVTAGWRAVARRLMQQTSQTIELHRFAEQALVMVDRLEPEDAMISTKARIGFLRNLDELDALTQVVLAFGLPPRSWPRGRCWVWRNRRRSRVTVASRRKVVTQVRHDRAAADLGINQHGFFRYAAPVIIGKQLHAVLAIAQVCTPGQIAPNPRFVEMIAEQARRLSIPAEPTSH